MIEVKISQVKHKKKNFSTVSIVAMFLKHKFIVCLQWEYSTLIF